MAKTKLSVNLNKVALLRNQRDLPYPDMLEFAQMAVDAGAAGITIHPRPDERHIRTHDVYDLADWFKGLNLTDVEYNIEGYPDERFLSLVEEVRPHQVTLVPDLPGQKTSDHGWSFLECRDVLEPALARIRRMGARSALFADADASTVIQAATLGADRVEFYTGPYGGCLDEAVRAKHLDDLVAAVNAARMSGLDVNAGHDLTLENLGPLLTVAPEILEVSIGHALTIEALHYGFAETIRRYGAVIAAA